MSERMLNKSLAISVDVRREMPVSLAMCVDVSKNTEFIVWIAWMSERKYSNSLGNCVDVRREIL